MNISEALEILTHAIRHHDGEESEALTLLDTAIDGMVDALSMSRTILTDPQAANSPSEIVDQIDAALTPWTREDNSYTDPQELDSALSSLNSVMRARGYRGLSS